MATGNDIPRHITYSGLDLYELRISSPSPRLPVNIHRCRALMEVHEVLISVNRPIFANRDADVIRDALVEANWNGDQFQICDTKKTGKITIKFLGNRTDIRSNLPESADIVYLPLLAEDLI